MKTDTSISIEKVLSLNQIIEIVRDWRQSTNITKEIYIETNPLNADNLIFLRVNLSHRTNKNEVSNHYKLIVWSSDFQLNRLRMVNHLYIDGIFVTIPQGYTQLLVISIRDPNTDRVFPALFALINTKEEEEDNYYLFLNYVKDIVTEYRSFDWGLKYASIDFEEGLQEAFRRVFKTITIIRCIFHYRQALFRQVRNRGLTTQGKVDDTQRL